MGKAAAFLGDVLHCRKALPQKAASLALKKVGVTRAEHPQLAGAVFLEFRMAP